LKEFVTAEQAKKKVFPPADEIYSWSTLCPLKDVKVVIIGMCAHPYLDSKLLLIVQVRIRIM
jgi:uracil-DNA glycosylase